MAESTDNLPPAGPLALVGAALVGIASVLGLVGGVEPLGSLLLLLAGGAVFGVGVWAFLPIRRTRDTRSASLFVASGGILVVLCILTVVTRKGFVFGEHDFTVEVLAAFMIAATVLVGMGADALKRATGA